MFKRQTELRRREQEAFMWAQVRHFGVAVAAAVLVPPALCRGPLRGPAWLHAATTVGHVPVEEGAAVARPLRWHVCYYTLTATNLLAVQDDM